MSSILVTGGDGLVAHALKELNAADHDLILLGHRDFDLTNPVQMRQQLDAINPQVVINTAAYNLVEQCEKEREISWNVNATGPGTLAQLCAEKICAWCITARITYLMAQKMRLIWKQILPIR